MKGTVALLAVAITGCANDIELGTAEQALDVDAFVLPSMSTADRAAIVHKYDALDPTDQVPRGLLEDALVFYDLNEPLIPKTHYLVVIDFSRHSGKDRFWLVDTTTGAVEAHKVAHGDGSDPDNDGKATLFGNVDGSHRSSLGFYLTAEIYDGTHPHSMRLDGLSKEGSPNNLANTNVRDRLIVMHEASYVDDGNTSQQGRSNGCPALDPSIERAMVDRIHDGTLMYAALSPLNPPVGRAMDGGDPDDPPADDPGQTDDDDPSVDDPMGGGCSTTGGGVSLASLLAFAGLRRRRRR